LIKAWHAVGLGLKTKHLNLFSTMRNVIILKNNLIGVACASLFLSVQTATHAIAQDISSSTDAVVHATLPPIPAPLDVPKPGPTNDLPYAPQPILQGGVVIPLFPPDSPYLNTNRIREAEVYSVSKGAPGRINYIINIHNPSIEVHTVDGGLNTGAAVILAAGGGHNTLNVGGESADFVPFFYNYGVNTVILRNRLRRDGYNPKTDEVYDAQQAIRLVRAHAKEWNIDPNKIGIMGFSAGAELVAATAIGYDDFDQKNNNPGDPLAGISSRPDFVGIIYPGPSLFARGGTPLIPHNVPPAFLVCGGSGDPQHAIWADEYFAAMLAVRAPDIEMHIYARGRHPGDTLTDGSHMTGGLTDRNNTPYGTWQYRFIDWFRDLGFLQKPGVETQAAKDVTAYVSNPPRIGGPRGGRGPNGNAGETNAPALTNSISSPSSPNR
jgi:alpha/beta hydrolase fold